MEERFKKVWKAPLYLYLKGCPIIIKKAVIQKDVFNRNAYVQLLLQNTSAKEVVSCKLSILAYAADGSEKQGIVDFELLDVNAQLGNVFGSDTLILLPDSGTRKIQLAINEVVFADGSLWINETKTWSYIQEPKKISEVLVKKELLREYKIQVGLYKDVFPEEKEGLIFCSCGAIYNKEIETCYRCHKSYDEVISCFDEEWLTAKMKKRRVNLIKFAIATCIMVGAVIATFGAINAYPSVKQEVIYRHALRELKNGSYDSAIVKFELLNEYKESKNQLKESYYGKAMEEYQNGNYIDAIIDFEDICEYKDAREKLRNILIELGVVGANNLHEDGLSKFKDIISNKNLDSETYNKILDSYYMVIEEGDEIVLGKRKWLVLKKEDNRALIIDTDMAIIKEFTTYSFTASWGECDVRLWLNDSFFDYCFDSLDKDRILLSEVEYNNPLDNSNICYDNVFLLSKKEIEQCGLNNACADYPYWTRDVDVKRGTHIYVVLEDGSLDSMFFKEKYVGVRPAMWICVTKNDNE